MGISADVKLIENGRRIDGRLPDELRKIRIDVGVIPEADGSAFIEWGGNKIICGIHGPRECIPKHEASPFHALLKCRYSMSPFASLEEHGKSGPSRRSVELSKVIREVLENLVITDEFPNTQIDVFIDVLQADGGTRTASIVAASVALANAGIPMRDIAAAVSVGKADGTLIIDLGKLEDNFGQSDMPLAFSARDGRLLLVQMDGLLTKEEIKQLVEMGEKAARRINAIQVESLKRFYEKGGEAFKL
ncbi:MAG: exosome complex exonuclease Rrp41 [Candidatus Bilamarchaeaceae archaeon]